MNTSKQSFTNNQDDEKVDGTLVSHASLRTSVRSSIPVARKKQRQPRFLILLLLPLAGLALILAVSANVLWPAFEGSGVALCAVTCWAVILWRAFRSFAIEQNLLTNQSAANLAENLSSGPNPAKPRKVQSSIPSEVAKVSAIPVASFEITRT